MTQRFNFPRTEPVHIPFHESAQVAARVVSAAFIVIAATALTGIAHADVDVSDSRTHSKLEEIESRLGNGNLNKSASNVDKTTSDLLKEIRTSVPKLEFSPTLTPNNQLKKITDTDSNTYIQKACSSKNSNGAGNPAAGTAAGSSTNVTTIATISAGDPSAARQQICQQIIQLRVRTFNDTIDMSDRFQKFSDHLTAVENNRESAKSQGDLWANTNESLRTMNKLQAEMGFWRTRLAAYDAAIKFHEGQQNSLSQTAIKGSGGNGSQGGSSSALATTAGSLIQTTALAVALKIK